jgi:hypothetical protein
MGGASREMDVFEVWLRGLAKRALTDGNLKAALEFLKICEKHGVIKPPASQTGGAVRLPYAEWLKEVSKLSPATTVSDRPRSPSATTKREKS